MRTIGSVVNGGRWRRYVVCTGRLRSPDVGTVAARLCCTPAILTLKCQRLARTQRARTPSTTGGGDTQQVMMHRSYSGTRFR
jgi:hypothetical protein